MKEHKIIRYTVLIAMGCIFLAGCYYDVGEELYPTSQCDLADVSYSTDIIPILTDNTCISCHNNVSPQGSIKLDTYSEVKINAENGKLFGSMNHDSGFKPMPQGSSNKTDQCSLDKIRTWIENGAQNN